MAGFAPGGGDIGGGGFDPSVLASGMPGGGGPGGTSGYGTDPLSRYLAQFRTGGRTTGATTGTPDYNALWSLMAVLLSTGGFPDAGSVSPSAGNGDGDTATDPNTTNTTPSPGSPDALKKVAQGGGFMAGLAKLLNSPGGTGLMSQLGGLGISAIGSLLQGDANAASQSLLKGTTDKFNQLGQAGLDRSSPYFDQSSGALASILAGSNPYSNLTLNSLIPNIGQLNNLLPALAQRNFATESPQIMDALGQISSNANGGPLLDMIQRAQQNMNNGGATADSRNMFGSYQAMQRGGTPVMQDLANGGGSLLASGGMTPTLQALQGAGGGTVQQGGMTPQLASALAQVQQLLSGGGATGATDALTRRGLQLAGGAPLAPMSLILSGATDAAGTRQAQAAEHARAEAFARGGGPGATVANGVSNQALADFADQGAQAQAAAYQDALTKQQGLQLQQTQVGTQMAQGGQSLEAQRLAELLNSVSNLTATSTGRMGVGGNLALGAAGNQTQNMATGGNLLSDFNQGSLGAGSLADAILTLEMGNQRGNMDLLSQGTGQQSGMLNSVIQSLLGGAQGGAQAGNQLGGLYLGNQNSYANILNNGLNNTTDVARQLGSLGSDYLNFSGNMFGATGPVATKQASFAGISPFGQLLHDFGASVASSGANPATTPKQTGA